MDAVGYRLRADLRTGWRSLVVIALLVGLAGGAALASLTAARRTGTAFARMRQATQAWDVEVNPDAGLDSKLTMAELAKIPGVERIGRVDGIILYPSFVASVPDAFSLPPLIVTDDRATHTVGRPLMVAGHQPAPGDPNGVWVERSFARSQHLRVGQSFSYVIMTPALLQQMMTQHSEAGAVKVLHDAPAGLQGHSRIDGIGVMSDGVVVDPGYTPASILFTPAFRVAHPLLQSVYWGAMVRLKPGTDVDTFTARVQALVPHETIVFQRATAVKAEVTNATDPEVMALEAFAALTALLGLVVVAQALSRRMQVDAVQNPTLAAMGATRSQRAAVSMAKAMVAVVAGAVIAVLVAVAASPLGPVGAVRVAEIHPGVAVDWSVLVLGLVAVVGVGAALAGFTAWRTSRLITSAPATVRSRVATAMGRAGGSVAGVVGVRFGLEGGSGRNSVPVRTTLLAAATAVALVTSVAVFSTSLDHLLATPRLYGSAWDAQIQLANLNTPAGYNDQDPAVVKQLEKQFVQVADHSGSVAASAVLDVGEVQSGPITIPALGYRPGHPTVSPTIAEGRAPARADEVALGQTTMDRLHTRIGGSIELAPTEKGPNQRVRVVGRAVLPGLAPYPGSDKAGLGVGALLTDAGWLRFSPHLDKPEYIFRWTPHGSLATLTATFKREMPTQLPLTVDAVNHPAGVVSLERLRATPTLLASLVALLLAAAVANALVVAVRRRRRDLAVLRTLGFTTGQVVRTVLWQATTVGTVAVVVGIPVGLVVGRWTWTVLADRLGAVSDPVVSAVTLVAVGSAVLILANLVGVVPGLRAARDPVRALRSE